MCSSLGSAWTGKDRVQCRISCIMNCPACRPGSCPCARPGIPLRPPHQTIHSAQETGIREASWEQLAAGLGRRRVVAPMEQLHDQDALVHAFYVVLEVRRCRVTLVKTARRVRLSWSISQDWGRLRTPDAGKGLLP